MNVQNSKLEEFFDHASEWPDWKHIESIEDGQRLRTMVIETQMLAIMLSGSGTFVVQ